MLTESLTPNPELENSLGQVVKFVHWQERPMFLSKAEVRPRPECTIGAIPLGGFVIMYSAWGDWSKRPFRTRRRMGGRTILR
jgi:hypothetical protein